MHNPVCHIVDKRVDGFIATAFGWTPEMKNKGMNPYKVASLRGLYDDNATENGTEPLIISDNPTDEELKEAAKKLISFRAGIRMNNKVRLDKNTKRMDRCYDALRYAYSLHQRRDRVNLLSNLFSYEVDRLMQGGRADRQAYIDGFMTVDGNPVGGTFSILEGVYNEILGLREREYMKLQDVEKAFKIAESNKALDFAGAPTDVEGYRKLTEHRYREYTKILENWNELIPFVLKDLTKKEGVKLGIKKEYTAVASSDSFGENDIAAKWDMSEAVRDGWQRNNDLESAFASVGQQVRRLLSTVPEMEMVPEYTFENGVRKFKGLKAIPVVDDLGNQKFMDATKTHQALMEYLKGIQDSEDLLSRMCKDGTPGVARIPWMQPIVDMLRNNPQAATQFFCDFKKNFQPYSEMWEDKKESNGLLKRIKTRIINKATNIIKSRYEGTMGPKGKHPANVKLWGYKPVFSEGANGRGGEVDWERLAELRQKVLTWTHEKVGVGIFEKTKTYSVSAAPLINNGKNATITIDGKTEDLTYDMRREFLMEVFSSLGYDVTMDTIDSILSSKDIYIIRDLLEQLFDPNGNSGFLYRMGDESADFKTLSDKSKTIQDKQKALERLNKKHIQYRHLYFRPSVVDPVTGKTVMPIKEKSDKILDIINSHQEGYRVESRARYQGNTLYSFVSPSYLGDRLEAIENYVNANDKEGLLKHLTEEYLESPFFVDDEYLATNGQSGRILNTWLAAIVDACKDKKTPLLDSVAAIFNYERDLGNENKRFEDFTEGEHGLDMFIHFFADEQQQKGYGGKGTKDIRKRLSAMYPVFILGDAGVSKYIRAPRIATPVKVDIKGNPVDDAHPNAFHHVEYKFDEIAQEQVLSGFWDIYVQEKRRMAIDEAAGLAMYANGKLVEHPKSEFSILTFLNPDSQEYNEKYAIPDGKEYDEETIKSIVREYLEDAAINGTKHTEKNGREIVIPSFKQRLQELGVLETVKVKENKGKDEVERYMYVNSIATPETIDGKVREFFWNTKLATAQQLQLMTIDPSFYQTTKDLQKRYKEIHAPGNVLDLRARDFDGNLYSSDGIERVVYFSDLVINAEKFNPEFMEVILRLYAKPGADVETAIAEGIVHPKPTAAEETARHNRIADLLGENYEIYEAYTENTLTDGQGFRTLNSYRKVMGMAGKWTRQMEEAYRAIMKIRDGHAVWENGKIVDYTEATPDELRLISQFAVVLQPIKPYMFTHEKFPIKIAKRDKNGNIVMGTDGKPVMLDTYKYIPVQHKYAEAIIIPELMPKGSKLRDLGFWMDAHNIDMAGSTKIAKVGCFGQAELKDCNDKASMENAMNSAYTHELTYRDYRIQTNVPEHINASQLFGTQVRKLIMAGLSMGSDYSSYLDTDHVNLSTSEADENNKKASLKGRNLLALYNSLICANITESYDKFAVNADDIEALSNLLMQSTVGSTREAMDNILSYVVTGNEAGLRKFLIPLFEGGLEHDAAALILSTFKKIVNKQQISGGSAVQVSAFGIKGYAEDGGLRYVQDPDNPKNILYAEVEMPWDRSIMIDIKGADGTVSKQKADLPYEKYCNLDGTLIPSKEVLKKGTKEWKKYQSYTYKNIDGKLVACNYDDPEAEVHKPLIEEEYPDILSILAYRIPTERDYSMLNCRIKRFTSKMAGGTIKVPPQGTTIAGFDFDIDKLYFMQREYHKHYKDSSYVEKNFSNSARNEVWALFYQENNEIQSDLEKARAAAEAKNPDLVDKVPVVRNGKVVRFKNVSKTRLNSYWKEAQIEEKYHIDKYSAFAQTAQKYGIKPTENINKGEVVEWLETYDFDKTPENNTRASRNNLLIDIIQARLTDPNTAKQRYTPGGFANTSKAARLMRELFHGDLDGVVTGNSVDLNALRQRRGKNNDPEPNYDPTNPYTILVYNQQNQVAGKLIGIFANQNTNHAFASLMDTFELNTPVEFCGHSFRDMLHKDPEDAARIDLNMAEFLAASVDAVKDPTLNFLNLNTATADVGAVLVRLGYNIEEVGLLLNQPVIRKVCEDSLKRGVKAATVVTEMKQALRDHMVGESGGIKITANDLAMGIVNERTMKEDGKTRDDFLMENAKMQMAVLDLFSDVLAVAQDVSDFVLSTKFTASNAVSSTFGGMYAQQLKVNEYVDKFPKGEKDKGKLSYHMVVVRGAQETGMMSMPISNDDALLTMSREDYLRYVRFNPFAYEQAMYDSNRRAIKLLSKYFPYETDMYKSIRGRMTELARYGTLSEDDINDIHSNIPVALLAKQERSLFNGEAAHVKDGYEMDMTNREYYKEKFAKDLMDLIAEDPEGLGSLEIFKYLYPVSEQVKVGQDPQTGEPIMKEVWRISMQDVGGMDPDTKEAIRESWAYLMEVKEDGYYAKEEYANLGRDLFMYCFYQLGFDFSPLSFMHLAPTAVKDGIKVERGYDLALNSFDSIKRGEKGKPSDDVLVWSPGIVGGAENAVDYFGADLSVVSELSGTSFQLPDNFKVNNVLNLVHEALSHPELTFKIDRDLTQEEFNLFAKNMIGEGVPANICFSKGTLNNVSEESKAAIAYGVRTYRQFLNEILSGEEQGLSPDEFAQMFILNHLDNSRFVMDINTNCNKELRKIIREQVKIAGNTLRDGTKFRDRIVLDVSKYQDEKDKDIIKDLAVTHYLNGSLVSVEWCPLIKIDGSYYMADSGTDMGFNTNRNLTMTYRKVVPWGTSKSLDYDGNQTLKPTMRYQSSIDAVAHRNMDYQEPNTPVEEEEKESSAEQSPESPTERGKTGTGTVTDVRQQMEDEIFNEYVRAVERKNGSMPEEDKRKFRDSLSTYTIMDLSDTVDDLRKACRENGVIMLNDQGDPMMGC